MSRVRDEYMKINPETVCLILLMCESRGLKLVKMLINIFLL